jgi:organic radical activating enzyme
VNVVAGPGQLVVSEVFGPTFQGEGPSVGRRAGFVRLGRCNLDCGAGQGATWACDTPYTWDWQRFSPEAELQVVDVEALVEQLDKMDVDLVVLTGGEPMLQQRRLVSLAEACAERRWKVEVETNGTLAPLPAFADHVTRFNVSPKLANSGVAPERALRPDALAELRASGKAIFKFVVAGENELEQVAAVVDRYDLAPVWIMPAGTSAEEILGISRGLADDVLARGWQLGSRLHVLLWADTRGR